MRGRRRAALVVLVAGAALGAGLACTGGGEDDGSSTTEVASTAPTGDPTHVPAAFAGAPDGWTAVGATDDVLVGLGGAPVDDERFGQTFDLETGALADIPAPPFDDEREVQVEEAVFGSATVVVGAFVYGPGIDPDEVDPTFGEQPNELVTYRLDPVERSWTRLSVPGPYAGASRISLRTLHAIGAEGSDGAVAVLGAAVTDDRALAVLEGDEWVVRGTDGLTDPLATSYCATDDALWQLPSSGGGPPELRPLALADGAALPVDPPERLVDDAWELAEVGCTADAVVLALSDNRDERPTVFVSTDAGTTWDEHPDPFGPGDGFLHGTTDGGQAVVVWAGGMGPEPSGRPTAVTAGAEVEPVDAEREDVVVWRGRTGSYVVIDSPEGAATRGDEPLPVRTVAVL